MTPLERLDAATSGPWVTSGDDVQYRVFSLNGRAWLTFQGTTSRSDWGANFDFPATPYRGQPVPWMAHRGFVRLWRSVRDEVVPLVEATAAGGGITVAGYSQGGALAVLAMEELVFRLGPGRVDGFTFGAPRVMWMPPARVALRLRGLTCYRRRGDLVPMVPPWAMGYCHVGRAVRVGGPALPWWRRHLLPEYEAALRGMV